MSEIVIAGNTSGRVTIAAPDVAGTTTLTLPATSGNLFVLGQSSTVTSGTSVTASGTSIDFTGIPSWVKRITVMFNGVSLNGTANILVQLGTGGVVTTTGYIAGQSYVLTSGAQAGGSTATNGFPIQFGSSNYTMNGSITFTLLSSNNWVASGVMYNQTSVPYINSISGTGALSGTLNIVRITSTTGTDTFDAGSINILYE